MSTQKSGLTYKSSGVDIDREKEGIGSIVEWVKKTLLYSTSKTMLDFGYFANVIDIGHDVGLAISTDGVGTKIMVAQMMGKYDTIGIDCIAMNVNDVLAVGARPITLVDYIAVQTMDQALLSEIGKGLHEGAKRSGISIVGGEIAQIRELLSPEPHSFDLVGTCIGTVRLDSIIDGREIEEHDVLIGIESSGVHSNGFTLARKALFDERKFTIDTYVSELGTTVGEELLKPTHIYVPAVLEMMAKGIKIKALAHITGGGLLNLTRINSDFGFEIEEVPHIPPIFSLIQESGPVSDEEMFRTYNMGVGFCLVTPVEHMETVFAACQKNNMTCFKLGHAVKDNQKRIIIKDKGLIGKEDRFHKI